MIIIEAEAGELHKKIRKENKEKHKKSDWNLETTQIPRGTTNLRGLHQSSCGCHGQITSLTWTHLRGIASSLLLTAVAAQVYSRISASGLLKNVHN